MLFVLRLPDTLWKVKLKNRYTPVFLWKIKPSAVAFGDGGTRRWHIVGNLAPSSCLAGFKVSRPPRWAGLIDKYTLSVVTLVKTDPASYSSQNPTLPHALSRRSVSEDGCIHLVHMLRAARLKNHSFIDIFLYVKKYLSSNLSCRFHKIQDNNKKSWIFYL